MKQFRMFGGLLVSGILLGSLVACGASQMPTPVDKITQIQQDIEDGGMMAATATTVETSEPMPSSQGDDIAPFMLPIKAPLPRSIHYAGLEWIVQKAMIDNTRISLFGDSDKRTDDYRVARISMMVKNPLSGYADLDSDLVKLKLGEQIYEHDETGMLELPRGNAQAESRLIFRLPVDATWEGAQLMFSEPNKVPAMIPLDGEMPAPAYPMKLMLDGDATVDDVTYTMMSGMLDLDLHDMRAEQGQRFLKLQVRVQNNSMGGGGMALTGDYFRLMVDGAPRAPVDAPIELVKPGSAYDAVVVFSVPETLASAELMVGEGKTTARLPLTF
jgi:hypothetical protein